MTKREFIKFKTRTTVDNVWTSHSSVEQWVFLTANEPEAYVLSLNGESAELIRYSFFGYFFVNFLEDFTQIFIHLIFTLIFNLYLF